MNNLRCRQLRVAFFFLLLAFHVFIATGQKSIEASPQDKVVLQADTYRGSLYWQSSFNQQEWTDISSGTVSPFEITLTQVPIHFRAKIVEENCPRHYSEVISVLATVAPQFKLWSDPATWSGSKPVAGQAVEIPTGMNVLLDESPPSLGSLTIHGTLEFMRKNLTLDAKWIMVHGTFKVGTEAQPFTHNAIITLTDANTNENIMGMGTRGIMVMGGKLELHGAAPSVVWTKINQDAPAGATSINLETSVDWKPGDQVVIGPTDYYGNGNSATQRLTLTAVNGAALTFNSGLNAYRWGRLQYATTSGMSLTSANLLTPQVPDTETMKTPLILDERAPIGNVTRNIVIQAPEDEAWINQGFGVHVMIMGTGGTAHVEGVEIRRGGQRGKLARYAFHWHMLSYSGTNTLPDASGQYFRKSSINSSANRGIVIHGTNGVLVQENIIYDTRGHAVFTEDAVERRNTFDKNLVLHVRNSSQPLKQHEGANRGSAGFWISNPDNTITNNHVADCRSSGFWLAFPFQPWGLSSSVLDTRDGLLLRPDRLIFGVFNNNTSHSNGFRGIHLDDVEIDNEGNTFPFAYMSTTNGRDSEWPFTTRRRFVLSNYAVWKNSDNGIWDRGVWPDNYGVVSADNCGRFFAGSGADGIIERSLVVGTSLNHLTNGVDRPANSDFAAGHDSPNPVAFATYHSAFDIKNNIVINFPPVAGKRSGIFSTDDYYEIPVDKGQKRNVNNLNINSHPGIKLYPPAAYTWFCLAGALWDPQGVWGPPENYLVYDLPFYTYGKTITSILPSTAVSGGVSVLGPFYGFSEFVLHGVGDNYPQNQPYFALMGIHVKRLNDALTEVGSWTVLPAPNATSLLPNKRHFAASPESIYELTFPQETNHPTNFQMGVDNMLTTDDKIVMSIQFSGAINAEARMFVYNGRVENYQSMNSLTEVRNSDGATFWQDKPNNRVWLKIRGGYWQHYTTNPAEPRPTSDDLLYEPTVLQIRPN